MVESDISVGRPSRRLNLGVCPQDSAPGPDPEPVRRRDEVEFMGVWPYGPCQAAAIDPPEISP
jgi:hypothetical protein